MDAVRAENPVPILDAVEPTLIVSAGTLEPTIDLIGIGFVEGAQALWNGSPRASTVLSPTRIRVTLDAGDPDVPGDASATVVNPEPGGGVSNELTVPVGNPVPSLSSVLPAAAQAVEPLTVRVAGTRIVPTATIRWNGVPLSTTVANATEASADLPDYLRLHGGVARVTIANPPPGGGESDPLFLPVSSPVPLIIGVDPDHVVADTDFILRLNGTGFSAGSTLWYGDHVIPDVTWTPVSLSASVPGSLNQVADTVHVRVESSLAPGGFSNSVFLPVWYRTAVVTSLSPSWGWAAHASLSFTIQGADFRPDATISWNGQPLAATVVDGSSIQSTVTSAEFGSGGVFGIAVSNPAPSVPSTTAPFTVLPAAPTPATVAYARGTRFFVSLLGTTTTVEVELDTDTIRALDAAPDGWTLVSRNRLENDLHVIDLTTGVKRELVAYDDVNPFGASLISPRFSADGAWVFFTEWAGPAYRGWRVSSDGSAVEMVVDSAIHVAPSSDLTRVVYEKPGSGELRVRDLATLEEVSLGVQGSKPRWSPDDEWIAYLTPFFGSLRAIRPDGTGDFQIATETGAISEFDWAEGGASLVAVESPPIRIAFPSGAVETLSHLGAANLVGVFGP